MAQIREKFPSPKNLPPGDKLLSRIRFAVKNIGDLQTSSVIIGMTPWLKTRRGRVLEVGCGLQPYRHLLAPECEYTGLDWEKSNEHFASAALTVRLEGGIMPD